MEYTIDERPSYSVLKVKLSAGESVTAEAGAMMAMKGDVEIKTKMQGGFFKSILRSLFGGESAFTNTFTAREEAEIWLAPPVPGDIRAVELKGESFILQDTAYLAHSGEMDLGVAFRGFKGFLTEGELIWLKVSGTGILWTCAFGGVEEITVPSGEKIIIDNFHFVGMDGNAKYRIRKFGGIKSFLLGGEGLVAEVEGPAKVLVQTRHLPSLAEAIFPLIRKKLRVK